MGEEINKIEVVVPPKRMNVGLDGQMIEQVNLINDPINENLINRLKVLCDKFNSLPDLDMLETRDELDKYGPFLAELGNVTNKLMDVYEECGLVWDEKRKEIEGSWS